MTSDAFSQEEKTNASSREILFQPASDFHPLLWISSDMSLH